MRKKKKAFIFSDVNDVRRGQFYQCFYVQLLRSKIPKVQKSCLTQRSFCAFGIFFRKSCLQNIDEIDLRWRYAWESCRPPIMPSKWHTHTLWECVCVCVFVCVREREDLSISHQFEIWSLFHHWMLTDDFPLRTDRQTQECCFK